MPKTAKRAKDVLPFSIVSTVGAAGHAPVVGIIRKGGPAPLWLETPNRANALPPDALVIVLQTPITLAYGFMAARYGDEWSLEEGPS